MTNMAVRAFSALAIWMIVILEIHGPLGFLASGIAGIQLGMVFRDLWEAKKQCEKDLLALRKHDEKRKLDVDLLPLLLVLGVNLKNRQFEAERAKLVREGEELERFAPTRPAVCHFGDEVLLSCGHIITTAGYPEFMKTKMREKASCRTCGETEAK